MNLQERLTLKGIFNPATEPGNQLVGDLTFTQLDGTDVALFGGFDLKLGHMSAASLYHGFSTKGKKMTLIDTSPGGSSISLPGIIQTGIHARYLLMGELFHTEESIVFDAFQHTCKDLNHWLNITGFEKPIYNRDIHTVHINYKCPESRKFTITPEFDLHVDFDYLGPSEIFIPSESITLEQRPYLKIISRTGKLPFKKFLECYNILQSFLSFCYFGYPVTTECVFKHGELDENNRPKADIELYYQAAMNYDKYKPHLERQNFLIRFTDIEDIFSTILQNWFLLREKIDVGINLLTELFMYRNSPIELRFLSMAQAAEHIHREVIDSNKMDLQLRLQGLLSHIPTDVRDAMTSDPIKFATAIKKNRNYFTHYNKKEAKKANRLEDIHFLGEKMKIILLTIILQELGIPTARVSEIILKNGMWLFNHLLIKPEKS